MADTFTIDTITPRTRAAPGGQFVSVQAVTFTTKPSGLVGTVDIPSVTFTPDEVAKVIARQAALLESVKAL